MTPETPDEESATRAAKLVDAWREARGKVHDDPVFQAVSAEMRQGHVLRPGEILAERYQLIGHRGDGPVAGTWLAVDLVEDAAVCVKVLHGRFAADALAMARFMTAGERVVSAPHVASVIDPGGQWAGFVWFALSGRPGKPLHQLVQPADLSLQAVIEVGQGLLRAHAQGLLHGALQPSAIRIDESGSACLHDFGLADGPLAGTWAAPELLAPEAVPTEASDVYGLAMCALYALNGGPLPFWAWRDPERLVDEIDLPVPVAAVLKQAVQWSPELRPRSVAALLSELLTSSALRKRLADACLKAKLPGAALAHLDWMVSSGSNDPLLWQSVALARQASGVGHVDSAWQMVLDHHQTPSQAKLALEHLVDGAQGRRRVVLGCELLAYLDAPSRPALQQSLGQILLDLGDPEGALPLFEGALVGDASPELRATVERLRTLRGDWTDVLAHLQTRIDDGDRSEDVLRHARAVARYAVRTDVSGFDKHLANAVEDADAIASIAARLSREGSSEAPGWFERLALCRPLSAAEALAWSKLDTFRASSLLHEAHGRFPTHLGLRLAVADLSWKSGEFDQARQQYRALQQDLDGSGWSTAEAAVAHRVALLCWLDGDLVAAAETWQCLLDANPDHRGAWWGVARVALWSGEEAAWLSATPQVYTPEEALARLLAGLVSSDWVLRFLARDAFGVALVDALRDRALDDAGGRLRATAVLVTWLQAKDAVGPALFEALADAFPEAGLPIEAVRWMWCEPATDMLFAIPDSYQWCGQSGRFDPRAVRRVLHLEAPKSHAASVDFSSFDDRDDAPLPIEQAWNAGTPVMAPERPGRWVLVADQAAGGRAHLELDGERLTLGGGPSDTWVLPRLMPRRVVIHRIVDRWYLSGDPAVQVNGRPRLQWRLVGGERVQIDGVGLAVHWLASGAAIPASLPPEEDDLELDLVDEWTDEQQAHAALVEVDGEGRLLFTGDELSLGNDPDQPVVGRGEVYVYRLRRTADGYTLEDRVSDGSELPPVLPLLHGDVFQVASRPYRFEVYADTGVSTPEGPVSGTDSRMPMLIIGEGDYPSKIVLSGEMFTIGRGQGNDLQLSNDSQISRHHCSIVRGVDGACVLKDAGSANGTKVNGRSVERHILQVGDKVRVGGHSMEFDLGHLDGTESVIEELFLDDLEETTASRADTAAHRRPGR